jgi:PAS domain S-box-containing protein
MPRTILIVDDNHDNLLVLRGLLEDIFPGVSVVEAQGGVEAIDLAFRLIPDLVLLDILMPGVDGFEVCSRLKNKAETSGIPVVMITALGDQKDLRVRALEVGADGFLSKPVDPVELTAQAKAMLRIRDAWLAEKDEKNRLELVIESCTKDLVKGKQAMLSLLEDLQKENTALRQTELKLRESDLLFETVMDNLPIGIAVGTEIDSDRFEYVNDQFCAIYRTTPEVLRNDGFWQTAFSDPSQRGSVRAAIRALADPETVKYISFDNVKVVNDSESFWIKSSVIAIPNREMYVTTVQDVTQQIMAQQQNVKSLERVRKTLEAVINAMSVTVETRDPYTAGHQRRVADLARAIATDLKLDANRIEGLYMAAIIHDLGKISLPAEILSMPRKLSEIEFSLVMNHSRVGYDILKDIDFPWPIARMVLEHHERLDGSGYPQRLTGSAILEESQIISVADIVEAIASHRPYRPALGIPAALQEITGMSGTALNPDIVNACVRVLSSGNFCFSQ